MILDNSPLLHYYLHFYPFRTVFILELKPRTPDDDMVGNEIARRTSFIHRVAYLRSIFGLLWRYAPYTFRIRLDLLSVLFFFGDFGRGRRKLQLYLAVECGKFGLQLFQLIFLVTQTP